MILKINGDIVSDDTKRIINILREWGYEVVGDYFAPMDLTAAFKEMPDGDRMEIKINSCGGDVLAGQEIYTMLRARNDFDIEVESLAASAASVIAMAGHSTISPVGMVMIHDVSTFGVSGNHQDMESAAKELKAWDEALANAYVAKTGRPLDEIIKLMDKETWLPAVKAVELGFIDAISDDKSAQRTYAASFGGVYQKAADIMRTYEMAQAERKAKDEAKENLLSDLDKFGA